MFEIKMSELEKVIEETSRKLQPTIVEMAHNGCSNDRIAEYNAQTIAIAVKKYLKGREDV